ncbi:MAG: condensation domain protein [Edaphobacter sp.]|nr:condensation domain protein [Edaphobacter sp.]
MSETFLACSPESRNDINYNQRTVDTATGGRVIRQRLSIIEQMADSNLVWFVRLEGSFNLDRLRSALACVQRKHPALRALIRKGSDGLYYEADCAPKIPLRIVPRMSEEDCRRECQIELTAVLGYDQPLLRAVWLQSELESDLLLTASHRICDAMSMFTLVREVLRSLHTEEELTPYAPITTRDLIGDFHPPQPWRNKLALLLMNGLLRLIPSSRRAPTNKEHHAEWKADRVMSDALRQRCKAEGVSIHAALTVTLERALFAVFGRKMFPRWILSPMDLRRGRFVVLKSDTVFSGAGNFKINTQSPEVEFWARARVINDEIQRKIEQEILDIPGRFYFLEKLRPLTSGQTQLLVRLLDWIMQMGDKLKFNGNWNGFGLSNLGNVVISDSDAPFRLKDLGLYVHSFTYRMLGLIPYSVNGDMRFYYVSDEKWVNRCPAETLRREFMDLLEHEVLKGDDRVNNVSHILTAATE